MPDTSSEKSSTAVKGRKTILFVCSGNTCRSPMARVLVEQKLKELGTLGQFTVQSAALNPTASTKASPHAREAIKTMYGRDLLADHKPGSLTPELVEQADLILVMADAIRLGLPPAKTYTVKEYGGETGDILDPFGGDLNSYLRCAKELSKVIDKVISRLLENCSNTL